ncbi:MAG: hypothetical protein Q9221_000740 [Calogaya cf. arnoldii]
MSTFNSRFIIWLWLTVLTMYMIITNSIADDPELIILSQKYCMDNIFCMILGALTGLSFGTWVQDGGESSPAILSNKLPTNNLWVNIVPKIRIMVNRLIADIKSRNNNSRDRHSVIHICSLLPLAQINSYIHIIALTTDAKLSNVFRNYPVLRSLASLCCVVQTLNYIFTSRTVKSYVNDFHREMKAKMQIIDKTTPLLSDIDGALLQVTPKTLQVVKQVAALPVYLLACYIIADVFSKGELSFLKNELLLPSVLAPCVFYGMRTSSSFKFVLDSVRHKIRTLLGGYAKNAPSTAHTEKDETKSTFADASTMTHHHATAAPITRETYKKEVADALTITDYHATAVPLTRETYEKKVADALTMTDHHTKTVPPTNRGKNVAHASTMTDSTQTIRRAAHICARCVPDLACDDKRPICAFRPTLDNGLQDMGAEAYDEMSGFSPVDNPFGDSPLGNDWAADDFLEEIL